MDPSNGFISYHINQKQTVLVETGSELLRVQLKCQLGGHPLRVGVIVPQVVGVHGSGIKGVVVEVAPLIIICNNPLGTLFLPSLEL